MEGEVKQLKSERLKEAEEKAKRDSEALKKQKLNEVHNSQTAKLATKTQEGQKQLYIARAQMTEEVFKLASDKLKAYAQTAEYRAKLNDSAKAVAELFGGKDCIIYVNERDIAEAEQFKSLFSAGSEVKADKTIQIGGVKAYCESMGIIADETLDSKLDLQREWFVENAELSVL